MGKKLLKNFIILLSAFLVFPVNNCWALQSHSAPEGIYVHQMAHLLFSGALAYLYWHTRKNPVIQSKGWKYLQIFCGFFIAWNLLALIGHEAFELLNPSDFIDKGSWKEKIAAPISSIKLIYYITKMDHFLGVPALFALVLSLRTFYHEALEGKNK